MFWVQQWRWWNSYVGCSSNKGLTLETHLYANLNNHWYGDQPNFHLKLLRLFKVPHFHIHGLKFVKFDSYWKNHIFGLIFFSWVLNLIIVNVILGWKKSFFALWNSISNFGQHLPLKACMNSIQLLYFIIPSSS